MDQKEKRNAEIINLHNSGLSTQQIADKVGLSKAGVYKVINLHLEAVKSKTVVATQDKAEPTKQTEPASTVIRKFVTYFGEYQRIDVNKYAHKQTGEVVKVKFVKAQHPNKHGHFEIV